MLSADPLLTAEQIAQRVEELAARITADSRRLAPGEPIHAICTLNGAVLFFADLIRALDLPVTIDFVTLSSYGAATSSSGQVRTLRELTHPIAQRHVLVVEDIVDTGHTLVRLRETLSAQQPRSLRVVSLLSKPSRREVAVDPDYLGFSIEDHFVVGYGLDVDQRFRNLPDIRVWSPDHA